jgi:peptide/nickel transport system permease protein
MVATDSVILEESTGQRLWHSFTATLHLIWRALWRNKVGFVGFVGLSFFLILTFIGPLFMPLDTTVRVTRVYEGPSAEFPLGTNNQGQDIFSHIVHGGHQLIMVAVLAGFLSTLIAVTFGSLAAFAGGFVDTIIVAIANFVLTIPQFPLLIVLAGVLKFSSPLFLGVMLAALNWPALLRAIRAQVLSLRERDYVEAAVALDLSTPHIIFRELLPNMMSYITISFILATTGAIYGQVGLVFLGMIPFAKQDWGVMINLAWAGGAIFSPASASWIMSPVIAISLFTLSLVLFARSLEELFNPRLRSGL